jgi:uncharacterized membrane protein
MEPPVAVDDLRWSLRLRSRLRLIGRSLNRASAAPAEERTEITTSVGARCVLGAATAGYVILFSVWTLRNHYGFGTFGFDLGIFDQGMWLLSRFKEPFVTVRGLNLFGDHTSFILLPLVPFYWLFGSAAVLLVSQSVAIGAGAIPAFLIGREKLRDERLACLVAVAYLAVPALQWTNLEQFHPDSFEIPLALFALYFMLVRQWRPFLGLVVLLLLVKEDVALLTVPLGLYVAVRYDRRVGVVTAMGSAAWFALNQWVILPSFNGGAVDYGGRVTDQFGGYGGFIDTAFRRPWELVRIALGPDRPAYLWQLLAPLALLPLLAPGILLIAIGPLLSNTLSTVAFQHSIYYHYSTLIIPILLAAAVVGIARFRSHLGRTVLATLMASSALATSLLWGPMGYDGPPIAGQPDGDPASERSAAIRDAIDVIPSDASVSAFNYVVPHLTHRVHIYEFPNPWRATNWADGSRTGERLPIADEVDYVVVPEHLETEEQAIVDDLVASEYSVVHGVDGFVVLGRRR